MDLTGRSPHLENLKSFFSLIFFVEKKTRNVKEGELQKERAVVIGFDCMPVFGKSDAISTS